MTVIEREKKRLRRAREMGKMRERDGEDERERENL
jgi:hypothetical protein